MTLETSRLVGEDVCRANMVMDPTKIQCSKCPDSSKVVTGPTGILLCGSCWAPLTNRASKPASQEVHIFPSVRPIEIQPKHGSAGNTKGKKLGCGAWIIIIAIGWAVIAALTENKKPSPPLSRYEPPAPPPVSRPVLIPEQLPAHGSSQNFTGRQALAPFSIQSSGSGYYFVKLVDVSTGADAVHLFVHGGRTIEIDVPLGSYYLKYATGQTWYGLDDYFGYETAYSEASTILTFSTDSYRYSGNSVTLYRVKGGNMHTQGISKNNF